MGSRPADCPAHPCSYVGQPERLIFHTQAACLRLAKSRVWRAVWRDWSLLQAEEALDGGGWRVTTRQHQVGDQAVLALASFCFCVRPPKALSLGISVLPQWGAVSMSFRLGEKPALHPGPTLPSCVTTRTVLNPPGTFVLLRDLQVMTATSQGCR